MPTRPIRPNAGTAARYEQQLARYVDLMASDAQHRFARPYSELAQDASPMSGLRAAVRTWARRWQRDFDALAPRLARWFAEQAAENVDRQMRADAASNEGLRVLLRRHGFTVRFKTTAAQREVLQAVAAEQASLISSIPEQHTAAVEGLIMRSVSTGRDLATLAQGLQKQHGMTKRRAARIALQANNAATAAFQRQRQLELGLTTGIWMHSAGGRVPRPTHVAHSGREYSIRDGIVLDPSEGTVWPGTAIRCRCVGGAKIPGWDD